MHPIDVLMNEHRQIEAALDLLDDYALRAGGGSAVTREELQELVLFIRKYADERHHGKEEDLLFDAMIRAGFPKDSGPIACMLHEHDDGRSHATMLHKIASSAGEISPAERQVIMLEAAALGSLLRNHILKEDRVLYPMAREHLSREAFEDMAAAFEHVDQIHDDAPEWPTIVALLSRIAA